MSEILDLGAHFGRMALYIQMAKYDLKQKLSAQLRLDACRSSDRVIIFGTGNFGRLVLHGLRNHAIEPAAFIDLNPANCGIELDGVPVLALEETDLKTAHVVLASNRNNVPYLETLLTNSEGKSFDNCDFIFVNFNFSGLNIDWSKERSEEQIKLFLYSTANKSEVTRDVKLNSVDIVLTEKCTLKCIDCSNLMQYYKNPKDAGHDELVRSLKTFLESVDFIHEIRLIGGEPLIYKNIDKIISLILSYSNFNRLVIFTNGTVVPRKNCLKVSEDNRVIFLISNYGDVLSKRVTPLTVAFEEHGINYLNERITTWQDCAQIEDKRRTQMETFAVFSNCCVNDALSLLHGKVYGCPFAAHADNLSAIPHNESDYVDLGRSRAEIRERLTCLVSGQNSLNACDYCNGRDYTVASVEAAVQTAEVLDYVRVQ